jgi:hypothetical protein
MQNGGCGVGNLHHEDVHLLLLALDLLMMLSSPHGLGGDQRERGTS